MRTFIALFRGLNVGGSHVLAMTDLVSLLEDLRLDQKRSNASRVHASGLR